MAHKAHFLMSKNGMAAETLEVSGLLHHSRKTPPISRISSPAGLPFQVETPAYDHRFLQRNKERTIHMRGIAASLRGNSKFSRIFPVKTPWVATVTPKKVKDDGFEKKEEDMKKEVDPIVTFSKPPPVPPVLGPIVLFSLWETWSTTPEENN